MLCQVRHLIERYQVDTHAMDNEGRTALDSAMQEGHTETANLLRKYMGVMVRGRPGPLPLDEVSSGCDSLSSDDADDADDAES